MKYLLMIYGNEEKWAAIPPDDFAAGIAKQEAFTASTPGPVSYWGRTGSA